MSIEREAAVPPGNGNPSEPEIAVVIPTRNRETRLAFALEALAGQTMDLARFEVIVVRSADAVAGPLAVAPDLLRVQFLVSARAGTAVQRNLGWRAARAPIVAFTDDDCRPSPRWLEELLAAKPSDELIVQGRTDADPHELHLLFGLARTITNSHESGWYETCNIAYSRTLLAALGGFDESITFLGEDADLGMRARSAGVRLRFAERARVWHAVHWRSLRGAVTDAWRRGTWPALVSRHPELRERLWLGVFTEREHLRLLVAIGGTALAGVTRSPVPALAALPFLWHRFDAENISGWSLARFPLRAGAGALVGATEIAACVASSWRHRTLVL